MVYQRSQPHTYNGGYEKSYLTHVIQQTDIQIPYQVPASQIQDLPQMIIREQAAVADSRAEMGQVRERINRLSEEKANTPACETASRVAGAALLVFAYAALAITLIGIVAIAALENADTFETVSSGPGSVQLRKEQERSGFLQEQIARSSANEMAMTTFKSKLPAALQTVEDKIAILESSRPQILPHHGTTPFWQKELNKNAKQLKEYRSALDTLRRAVA